MLSFFVKKKFLFGIIVLLSVIGWFYFRKPLLSKDDLEMRAVNEVARECYEYGKKELNASIEWLGFRSPSPGKDYSIELLPGEEVNNDGVHCLYFSISLLGMSYKDMDIDKAKKVVYEILKNLKRIIDENEAIRPFLAVYPYPVKYLRFAISPEFILPDGEEGFRMLLVLRSNMTYLSFHKELSDNGKEVIAESEVSFDIDIKKDFKDL